MEIFDFVYFLVGIVSGVLSGLFGIGGGMIIVPTMLVLGLSSHHAVAISVLQMIFSSIFGSFLNYKKKNLNLKEGLAVGLGGILGASFSGMLLAFLSDLVLTAIFLALSCVFFLKYAFASQTKLTQIQRSALSKNAILFCAGAFTGVFAISLGIGGGLLIAPILAYFLGYDSKKVTSLSLFFIIFASISGSISFLRFGVMDSTLFYKGVIVGIASMIGVFIGIRIMQSLHLSVHRKFLLYFYALSIFMTFFALLRKLEIFTF